jgi:tRNA-modifying protein YgfZ
MSLPEPTNFSEASRDPLSLAAQQAALYEGGGMVRLDGFTQIVLRGADRHAFLHGLCTQNIRELQPGRGTEGFVTNVQGKVVGHVLVRAGQEQLELITAPGQATTLLRHFDKYIIREDVQLTDESSQWALWQLVGPEALPKLMTAAESESPKFERRKCIDELAQPGSHVEFGWPGGAARLHRVHLSPDLFLAQVPAEDETKFADWLGRQGFTHGSAAARELWRLEIGFPQYGIDITVENLPQEVDRNIQGINFTKGCYLGQETVARLDALGHVNRRLMGLQLPGEMAWDAGTEVMVDGKVIVKVTSSAYSPRHGAVIGLGYVRRGWDQPGKTIDAPQGLVTIHSLPRQDR